MNSALVMLLSSGKQESCTQVFFLKPSQMFFPSCMLMQSLEKMLLISQSEKWQHSDLSMRGIPCLDFIVNFTDTQARNSSSEDEVLGEHPQ